MRPDEVDGAIQGEALMPAADPETANRHWMAYDMSQVEPGEMHHLPRNPVLDDYPGKTVGENLDHQLARTVFLADLLNRAETERLFQSIAVEAALEEPLRDAIAALEAIAARAGLESRGDLFLADVPPDVFVGPDEAAAIAAFVEAKIDAAQSKVVTGRLRAFVRTLGITWPWVEAELCLAFEVSFLDSRFHGLQFGVVLSGGPAELETSDTLEIDGFSIMEGEPVPDALKRLDDHEAALRNARRNLEGNAKARMPIGRLRQKTKATLARDVHWYFRRQVLQEQVVDIARDTFADEAGERRRDVRAGVQRARKVLDRTSFEYDAAGEIAPRDSTGDRGSGGEAEAQLIDDAAWADQQAKAELERLANDPVGLVNLSLAFALSRRHQEAVDAADRALVLVPDLLEARINRALNLRELGRLDESRGELERCLAAEPNHPAALHSMAATMRDLGFLDEALGLITREIEVKQDMEIDARSMSHSLLDRARLYVRRRRFAEAEDDFDRACEVDPGNQEAWHARGEFRAQQGEHELAIADFRQLTDLDPDEPSAWNGLGSALAGANRPMEAIAALDRALALRPSYSAAHVNRGLAFWLLGRLGDATHEYQAALAADPGNGFPHMNLALMKSETENALPEALEHAQAAARLLPKDSRAHETLGIVLMRAERDRDASAVLQRAADLDPWSPSILYNLALAQAPSDQDQAMSTLGLLLSRFPEAADSARQDEGFKPLRLSDQHRSLFSRMVGE